MSDEGRGDKEGREWRKWKRGGREGEVEGLHDKFHLNVFIVSASGGQQPQFWANFGGSCVDPLLPMRAKCGIDIALV